MNKEKLIKSLKHLIEHNEERLADHEKLHGEWCAKNPEMHHSIDSEMADWHRGKINAYSKVIEMLGEA